MRAAQFSEFGGLEALRLEEVVEPRPGPGEILINVAAVGLNFFDTLMLRNKYQVTPPLPFSPGAEIAGTIEELGEGVVGFGVGQRVVAFIGGNGCREKVVTKARNAVLIPDGVSDETAAGIPITYGTALHAFKDRALLRPGETVAVLGAAGGAGRAGDRACLLGRQARLCPAAWRRRGHQLRNRGGQEPAQGADHAERRRRGVRSGGRKICRADAAGDGLGRALSCARFRLGRDSAHAAQSAVAQRLLVALDGEQAIPLVERNPDKHRANMQLLLEWCKEGRIVPHVHASFALVETAKALSLIEGRKATGKVIVKPQL